MPDTPGISDNPVPDHPESDDVAWGGATPRGDLFPEAEARPPLTVRTVLVCLVPLVAVVGVIVFAHLDRHGSRLYTALHWACFAAFFGSLGVWARTFGPWLQSLRRFHRAPHHDPTP